MERERFGINVERSVDGSVWRRFPVTKVRNFNAKKVR